MPVGQTINGDKNERTDKTNKDRHDEDNNDENTNCTIKKLGEVLSIQR